MTISSFLLLLLPFIVLPFLVLFSISIHSFMDGYYRYNSAQVYDFLLLVDIMAISMLFVTCILQSKYTLFQNSMYALGSPLAGVIIFFAFISSILDAPKKNAVNWKDRTYTIKESH